jgi:hypothetical protein
MLYGMIAAIFVAVVMIVLTFVQAGQVQEGNQFLANPQDPTKVLDTKGVQEKAREIHKEALNKGYGDPGAGMAESLKAAMEEADRLRASVDSLTNILEGTSASGKGAVETAARVAAKGNKARDLAREELKARLGIADADQLSLDAAIPMFISLAKNLASGEQSQKEQFETKKTELTSAQTQHAEAINQKDAALAALADTNAKTIKDIEAKITEAQAQEQRARNEYEAARKAHNDDLELHKKEIQAKVDEIAKLNVRLREMADQIHRGDLRQFEADGSIIKLEPGEQTGYINLGRVHSVFNGLTFTVWSEREVGKQEAGTPKGFIRISKVMDTSSEFVIVKLNNKSDPIITGDVITNVVFDVKRPFHFAVVGRFDINSDGTDDTDMIKAKIRAFGGKVQDELTVQTDYLVVGDDPMNAAPKLGSAAPSPQQALEIERLKKLQAAFGDATDTAKRLHIPVLSTNRFLSLTGIQ